MKPLWKHLKDKHHEHMRIRDETEEKHVDKVSKMMYFED